MNDNLGAFLGFQDDKALPFSLALLENSFFFGYRPEGWV
jgi:hypothetical protein